MTDSMNYRHLMMRLVSACSLSWVLPRPTSRHYSSCTRTWRLKRCAEASFRRLSKQLVIVNLIEFCFFSCLMTLLRVGSGKANWDTTRSDLPQGSRFLKDDTRRQHYERPNPLVSPHSHPPKTKFISLNPISFSRFLSFSLSLLHQPGFYLCRFRLKPIWPLVASETKPPSLWPGISL